LIEHHVCEMVARKPSDTSGEVDESARGADGENQSADSSAEKSSRAIRVGGRQGVSRQRHFQRGADSAVGEGFIAVSVHGWGLIEHLPR
jgi:hypothetical protein